MAFFAKLVHGWKPLIIFTEAPILDVQLGFEFTSILQINMLPKVLKLLLKFLH